MSESKSSKQSTALGEAGIAAGGMCLFSLFIHSPFPLVLLSICGLLVTAVTIHHFLGRASSPARVLGIGHFSQNAVLYTTLGVIIGLGLGVACRLKYRSGPFPAFFTRFALLGALIGATEELVYRGYLQGRLGRLGALPAVALAALCHTAYKCGLFLFPPSPVQIDLVFLGMATFLGGLVFGALRAGSRSVVPPLAAHIVFDIIVYGDHLRAPWWVWG